MPESVSFGTWLRQRRRALDLTQKALAEQVSCAEITVRRMEADEYKPSSELALKVFEKLEVPESERPDWVRFARGLAERPKNRATPSSTREQRTNLPVPLTSFVGREKDVALIQQRLAKHRLVTLIGTGGIGKTRLSQHVASQLMQKYNNGVWLVELASLSDPALVPQTVAAVFGIQPGTDRALIETLIHFLRAKTILLILDNCEHLLDACAGLANQLLKNCPNLKILATSREAMGIIGEALYQAPALTIPEIQKIETIEKLNDYESIRLFDERAQLVQMDFAVTTENAASVVQICRRLDGIPLAIELAAVRVQTFSAEQIAMQLNECFHTLTGGSRTALPRHQTLQASIDWSWRLLYEPEQTILRRLAVFAGGFTVEAAGQVCAGDGIESRQVTGVISQLVTKSLILVNQDTERARRYRLLETIRQYARERLIESGEQENIRTRHLKYFSQFAEQAELALRGPGQAEWYARLFDERDNIRAALEWADQTNDVEAGLYLSGRVEALWKSFDMREGARWLAKFIEKSEAKDYPRARAKALLTQGWLLTWFQQFPPAYSAVQECLELFRACGDKQGEVDALLLLGNVMQFQDSPATVLEINRQALALARSLGDKWRQAKALLFLVWDHRDHRRTFDFWEEALALFREAGDWRELTDLLGLVGLFRVLNGEVDLAQKYLDEATRLQPLNYKKIVWENARSAKSLIALMRGDYEQARALLQETLTLAHELGNRMDYLWAGVRLGYVALREGNRNEARNIFTETAREFLNDNNEIGVAFTLEGMAGLYIEVGNSKIAARLIGWADAAREKISDTRPRLEQADVDKIIAACLAQMGEAAFSDAYEEGKKMTLDEAVKYALEESHD